MGKPILFTLVASPYLVDDNFDLFRADTEPPKNSGSKEENVKGLERAVERLSKLQAKLYASDTYAVLLVFQAMDAAGKDGTISAVLTGVNPQGCQVSAFKTP